MFLTNPIFAASTVTPADKMGEEWWGESQCEILERVKEGNVDLILLATRSTSGWENVGKEVLRKYYGRRNAVNMGFGGDRTDHVLWRLDNGEVDGISPKVCPS
jgi:beta-glucosidase